MTTRQLRNEDFDLPSGFADDFDATVVDAWFGAPREEYVQKSGGEAPSVLHLKLEGPDLDKPIEQVWSTGGSTKWQVARGGKEIVNNKNPDSHQFVATSRAGELVNRIITLAGGGDRVKGVEAIKGRGYLMTEAEFYIGLNCHWEQEEKSTVGGEVRNVLMPTSLLSVDEAVGAPAEPEFSDAEVAQLVSLAKGKTEGQLKPAVMRSPQLKENKKLLNAIFNGDLLKRFEEGGTLTKDPSGKYL